MQAMHGSSETPPVELGGLFGDLVSLETELRELVDHRLREDHDLPFSWFEPMPVIDDARSSVVTLSQAGQRVLQAAQGSCGTALAARLGAAVSPGGIASFASTVRDLRRHVTGQQGSAR